MDLNLSKDHKIVKETVSKIAQKELVPRASEIDKTHSFVWEGLNKLKEADMIIEEGRSKNVFTVIEYDRLRNTGKSLCTSIAPQTY